MVNFTVQSFGKAYMEFDEAWADYVPSGDGDLYYSLPEFQHNNMTWVVSNLTSESGDVESKRENIYFTIVGGIVVDEPTYVATIVLEVASTNSENTATPFTKTDTSLLTLSRRTTSFPATKFTYWETTTTCADGECYTQTICPVYITESAGEMVTTTSCPSGSSRVIETSRTEISSTNLSTVSSTKVSSPSTIIQATNLNSSSDTWPSSSNDSSTVSLTGTSTRFISTYTLSSSSESASSSESTISTIQSSSEGAAAAIVVDGSIFYVLSAIMFSLFL